MKFTRITIALILCILLVSGVGCEQLGLTGATPTPTPTPTATANASINASPNVSPLTTDYGASILPVYDKNSDQIFFSVTAYAKEPSNLYVYDPNNSELGEIYVPPKVEKDKISESIHLPPVPIGGQYRLMMLSELTDQLVWQSIQTFNGSDLWIMDYSLNPVWERGLGWDLQHLTMTLINKGDMPVTLNGLKLKLEKGGSSAEEITLAQADVDYVEYGWETESRNVAYGPSSGGTSNMRTYAVARWSPGNMPADQRAAAASAASPAYVSPWKWVLPPWEKAGDGIRVIPYNSTEQHLFGHYFDPGEYQLSIELSGFLWVLEEKELNFEQNPASVWGILPDKRP